MSADDVVVLDCETTGLHPIRHQIFEVSYAIYNVNGFTDITTLVLPHDIYAADPLALDLNGYHARGMKTAPRCSEAEEDAFQEALVGSTIAGFNPRFDVGFLAERWGIEPDKEPWKYRLLDLGSFTAGYVGWARSFGAAESAAMLNTTFRPTHTSETDVRSAIEVLLTVLDDGLDIRKDIE